MLFCFLFTTKEGTTEIELVRLGFSDFIWVSFLLNYTGGHIRWWKDNADWASPDVMDSFLEFYPYHIWLKRHASVPRGYYVMSFERSIRGKMASHC